MVVLEEPATDEKAPAVLNSTSWLSDDELEAEIRRILPFSAPQSDLATIPDAFLKSLEQSASQEIFVAKDYSDSFWKRLWRMVSRRKRQEPLTSKEDTNSTTDSTEYDTTQTCAHFSVSTTPYHPLILPASQSADGNESIELAWPSLFAPQTGKEMANSLRDYMEQHEIPQRQAYPNSVDFDQIGPSDSKSLDGGRLAVSFDNQEECAQLVFQNSTGTDSNQDEEEIYAHPVEAHYPSPVAPLIPSVERFIGCSEDRFDWFLSWEEETAFEFSDPPLELMSHSSVEVSLNDDNTGYVGWSYDEISFSSLLLSK